MSAQNETHIGGHSASEHPPALLIRGARVVTPRGAGAKRGGAMRDLEVLPRADVLIERGVIARIEAGGRGIETPGAGTVTIDAHGRVLCPAFVDCHTHALWAGSRLDEWARTLAGATYTEILQGGGGIMSTVRAVRAQTQHALSEILSRRVREWFVAGGTLTAEVKSGYGLDTRTELAMLRAIGVSAREVAGTCSVRATALLGHAIEPGTDARAFVRRVIDETLPAVHAEFPGIVLDAYCEKSAWSVEDCVALFEAGARLGHACRVHADQFSSLGMVREALRLGAKSIDHLEASTDADMDAIGGSATFAVVLPLCGLHLDNRFARGRRLIDAGAGVCVATNCNPGSAPSASMALAMAMAVRRCGLTPAEALTACTVNAATLLGLDDRGYIAPGARADVLLLTHSDERELAYCLGGEHVDVTVCGGAVVRRARG